MPVATEKLDALRASVSRPVATDAAACARFAVDGLTPAAVVEPTDAKELVEIVRWARSHRAALIPATSGCYLPIGNPPAAADAGGARARPDRGPAAAPGRLPGGRGARRARGRRRGAPPRAEAIPARDDGLLRARRRRRPRGRERFQPAALRLRHLAGLHRGDEVRQRRRQAGQNRRARGQKRRRLRFEQAPHRLPPPPPAPPPNPPQLIPP